MKKVNFKVQSVVETVAVEVDHETANVLCRQTEKKWNINKSTFTESQCRIGVSALCFNVYLQCVIFAQKFIVAQYIDL